jgi:hypothetical protein
MSQDRNYFGMTMQQVRILIGLGVIACFLFGVIGILVLRGGVRGLYPQASVSTPVVHLTATPFALPTGTPTETPTPIPYDQLIPSGWIQHKTPLVELWLPSDFKSAGTGAGSDISGNAVFLELAYQSSSESSPHVTSISVWYEPLTKNTLNEFVDLKVSGVPPEINVAEHRKVIINSMEAYRLMFERHSQNVDTNDLLFVIQDGITVWFGRFSAELTDYYETLPVFEQSIKTFRMVR